MAAEVLHASDRRDDSVHLGEINPAFSFPMSPPSPAISPLSVAIPIPSRSRPADISIQPVPAFSFPPPATPPLQEGVTSSPSRSRPAGHRRGPSEFIGGDGSKLGPGLMSTSPTKGENALPTPGTSAGRKRGHAHRRSAAISHHDLTNIIGRPDSSSRRHGSAPATPCEPDMHFGRPILDRARSQPELPHNDASLDLLDQPESPVESSPSATSRPRVGFSDKLEYIPRPLSIISSATSSSISTIRPSHSLNNSITSLRSLGTSSPPSAKKDLLSDDIFGGELHQDSDGSPSRDAESRFGKGSSKSRRFSPPPPSSQEYLPLPEEEVLNFEAEPTPQLQTDLSRLRGVPDFSARPRSSPESVESKRSQRGKSWSGLLSRKPKHELAPLEFVPRPNDPMPEAEPDFSMDDINFDEDSTYVIRSPEFDVARSVNSNPSPMVANFDEDTDVGGPQLDLDEVWYRAGMNTKETTSDASRARQSKRAMHSSGATGGFAGPGMHYHRRAESAPVMPPVDYGLGFPRYGSNPQMADVFEEEEDAYNENSLSRQASRQNKIEKHKKVDALGVNVEEPDVSTPEPSPAPVADASFKPVTPASEPTRATNFSLPSPPSNRSLRTGKDLSIQTVATEQRSSLLAAHPMDSTAVPIQSSAVRNYASSHGSYPSQSDRVSNFHGSTDASPLQTSFDVPRLNTAHSTGTDRSAWSSARNGESGHPHATSIDDVPSLVSSSSTMISHLPHTPIVGSRMPGERSQSMSAEVSMRPRTPLQAAKRASLASLSKLMGGSFSEKSKLSIESKADYDDEEDSGKVKKRHRISRLMRMKFWKSKEDVRSLASSSGPKSS